MLWIDFRDASPQLNIFCLHSDAVAVNSGRYNSPARTSASENLQLLFEALIVQCSKNDSFPASFCDKSPEPDVETESCESINPSTSDIFWFVEEPQFRDDNDTVFWLFSPERDTHLCVVPSSTCRLQSFRELSFWFSLLIIFELKTWSVSSFV